MTRTLVQLVVLVGSLGLATGAQAKMTEYGISGGNVSLATNPMLHTTASSTNVAAPTYLNLFYTIDDGDWYWLEIDYSIAPAVIVHGLAYVAGAELPDWTPTTLMGSPVLSGPPGYAFFSRLARLRAAFTYPIDIPGKLRVGLMVDADIMPVGLSQGPWSLEMTEGANILASVGPTAMWCPIDPLALKLSLTGGLAFMGGDELLIRGGFLRSSAEVFYELWENAFWAYGRLDGQAIGWGDDEPALAGGSNFAVSVMVGLHWNWLQALYDVFGE
jgi:hypothetical protein